MTSSFDSITALILAGGRGLRMGGVDKGLQPFRGLPLVQQTRLRLQQQSRVPEPIVINANRHLDAHAALGAEVWPDTLDGFAGPLAGFLTGLQRCRTPLLLTVPCDTPLFPLDLVERLHDALVAEQADMAMVLAREGQDPQGPLRPQPVFCLLRAGLQHSLADFMRQGGRKVDAWTARHRCARVAFYRPQDSPNAFFNANTLQELQQLESP